MRQKLDRRTALEVFDNFIFKMDGQLEGLQELAAETQLDYSLDSVDRLEMWFSTHRADMPNGLDEGDLIVLGGRYLGEVMRLNFKGVWHLSLENPQDLYYNQPVIVGHTKLGTSFAPISVMRGFALRGKQGALRKAIEAQVDFRPPDTDGMVES